MISLGGRTSNARTALQILILLGLSACTQKMAQQPRYSTFDASSFFDNGASARVPVPGTVAREYPKAQLGQVSAAKLRELTKLPLTVTPELLHRGQERYTIYCSPCHGAVGDGRGLIVTRGFIAPPSYHTDRLRQVPIGHFYDVMTRGYGAMYSYASRVSPQDRWAVAAYIRALQLSQNAKLSALSSLDRSQLEKVQK